MVRNVKSNHTASLPTQTHGMKDNAAKIKDRIPKAMNSLLVTWYIKKLGRY